MRPKLLILSLVETNIINCILDAIECGLVTLHVSFILFLSRPN